MSSSSRLFTALEQGVVDLDGSVAVLRPPADYDLPEGAHVVHTFKPDVDHWAARGHIVTPDVPALDVVVVVLPRAKALARDLIAQANAKAGRLVIIDGQKTDGSDSLFKACRKKLGDLPSITKSHGRLFWFAPDDSFADWAAPAPSIGDHGFYTAAGVFSDGQVDRGSDLLAQALPDKLPGRIADLGAGWGFLSAAALTRDGVKSIDLIEAEALSLDCARLNVTDPRAAFHWADATTFQTETPYDAILCNPPFHNGRAADPTLGRAFIAAAARLLKPHGHLWLVANRHLPYEQLLKDKFRKGEELYGDAAFKLFHASRPIR